MITDIPSLFIKKPGQKFESECLIMPPTDCAAEKKLNKRYAQMASNSRLQTFCFQGELYFILFFFHKLKQIYSLPIFITVE